MASLSGDVDLELLGKFMNSNISLSFYSYNLFEKLNDSCQFCLNWKEDDCKMLQVNNSLLKYPYL